MNWSRFQSKTSIPRRGEFNVYSTFQSHEPEFDYLKSLEIEEKINKIRWLRRKNPAHFLLSTNGERNSFFFYYCKSHCEAQCEGADSVPNYFCCQLDKTIKLWKVSEKEWRVEGFNLKEDSGVVRDPSAVKGLQVNL